MLTNFAPNLAGGTPQATGATPSSSGGFFFPTPPVVTASYNPNGTVNASDANAYGEG